MEWHGTHSSSSQKMWQYLMLPTQVLLYLRESGIFIYDIYSLDLALLYNI